MRYKKYMGLVMAAALAVAVVGCGNEREENMAAYRQMGINCMETGDYAGAVTAFDSALGQCIGQIGEEELDICYYKAAAQYVSGDVEGAMDTYTSLIAYDFKEADAYYLRGCLYLHQGDAEKAKADFDQAIKYNSDDYELYIHIYENLSGYGMTADAESYLNKAFSIKGSNAKDQAYRGEIYFLLGQYDNAAVELAAAVEGGNTDANFYLGQAYEARGEEANAQACYQAYIDAGAADAESLNAIGEIMLKKGSYAEALSYFEQAMEQEEIPNRRTLLQNLIIAYEYNGDFASAWSIVQEYVSLYPEDAEAQREYLFLQNRQAQPETASDTPEDTTSEESTESVESTENQQ